MQFYSTRNPALKVNLKQAILQSLASDGGLFMPEHIEPFKAEWWIEMKEASLPELAAEMAAQLLGTDIISNRTWRRICEEAFNFPLPLKKVEGNNYILELFHGPSAAFKDFGARFLSRLTSELQKEDLNNGITDVLVATSGDTGGAVAAGFLGVEGIRVTILFPKGKVSALQRLQLTTQGQNIRALEVAGTFDDCQDLVKKAFNDSELQQKLNLTSANSINLARLVPQAVYYAKAALEIGEAAVFSVPSGNFGNLCAGLLAQRLGAPIKGFVAANNTNHPYFDWAHSGKFEPHPSIATSSNAMDVGNPSNFARILDLFHNDRLIINHYVYPTWFTDKQAEQCTLSVFERTHYVLEPHTAIGWLGLEKYRSQEDFEGLGIVLATAHPAKFLEAIPKVVAQGIILPESMQGLNADKEHFTPLLPDFNAFKAYLMSQT